jgi:hypothetical protein
MDDYIKFRDGPVPTLPCLEPLHDRSLLYLGSHMNTALSTHTLVRQWLNVKASGLYLDFT